VTQDKPLDPIEVLERISRLLQTSGGPAYRGRVFRRAARALRELTAPELAQLAGEGRLREIAGVGPVVEGIVVEVLREGRSPYLERIEADAEASMSPEVRTLLEALRGDCHMHSDWSDGRVPIEEMAFEGRGIGHEYMVLTDHSPRLTIANGLTPERLWSQIRKVGALNESLAPMRLLTGIECDVLDDGSLDQTAELLGRLEVVVGSVHSKLRMPAEQMTPRLLNALAQPHLDILGHCTGRLITRRGRPESEFDAAAVFAACVRYDKAIEINCRPERLDPPRRLLRMAVEAGCKFAINTDAHTPEELHWQRLGCERAAECGVKPDDVVNTWPLERLLAWTASHESVASK